MTYRFYTNEDSQEVRATYYEARKNAPKSKQKLLITRNEWNRYQSQGADMSRFEVWKDFVKRVDKEKHEKIKNERAGKPRVGKESTHSTQGGNKKI